MVLSGTPDEAVSDNSASNRSGFSSESIQFLVSVVSQTTIIVGSLFYFGFVRTSSTFGYLGLDVTLLGFSTVDYVLRSGNAVFIPLILIASLLLYLRLATELLRRVLKLRPRGDTVDVGHKSWTFAAALASACTLMIPVAVQWSFARTVSITVFLLLFLVAIVVAAVRFGLGGAAPPPGRLRAITNSSMVPLGAIAVAIFFYATALQAQDVGVRVGREIEQQAAKRPSIVVYAETPLGLSSTAGVVVEALPLIEERYKFRIVGLRLLTASGDKYFLLRPNGSASRADIVVIAEQDVRIDVTAS